MNDHDGFYQAMLARDHRFDGKFFVGVKTTGIYCRPICPAKPKKENVEFFASARLAEQAGYRPCLRCRPEVAPHSPAWMGTSAIVQRALRKIHTHQTAGLNEDEFAGSFGVGARHLRRLFIEEIGKTPKQIAIENRLNLSRTLIVETALPMTEIAYASGFQSIRRFNDAFKARFRKKPSEIRRIKRPADAPLVVSAPYRPPFDFERLLHFYRIHPIGDLEKFEPGKMIRTASIEGRRGRIAISNDPDRHRLLIEIDQSLAPVIHTIVLRVRLMFDLDSDPLLIANAFDAVAAMAKLFKKYPGIRVPAGWDPFEISIATILGQLVSVQRASALLADLIRFYGEESDYTVDGKRVIFFPTPQTIARSDLAKLKTTGMRKQTLRNFARAVLEGKVSLETAQNIEEFRAKLLKIKGIGPWTADYMSLKVLGHADAFPATDLILARALKIHSKEIIERLSPWRAYAAVLLWSEYAGKIW